VPDRPMIAFRRRLPGVVYGGDYNPEQWPSDVWREDVRLMREANVCLVSVGVFSWSRLEVADGEYDFGWLDEVMDLLAESGISVNLATPNASPPPWLAEDHPESLAVDRQGVRVGVGGRGHLCPSSDVYRDRSRRIARKLAERYRDHPALAMWHIGNEYHAYCFCDRCDERFREWLQARYGTLDELNRRWGTAVWSQRYGDWGQVHVPRVTRGWMNPTRELDFVRFTSDVQLELFIAERDLLREITPDVPATTNFFAFNRGVDARRWAREVDVVAFDMYPDPAKPESMIEAAFQFDLMRSIGAGAPWMLMEQATGAVSQWKTNVLKPPGRMRLDSFQAIAHGSDSVMFFQWRAARQGQEKFHSAMVPHGGVETRTWQEVRGLGAELLRLGAVTTGHTRADVAIVWDWSNWWAVEGVAHPVNTYNYRDTVLRHYRALWNQHVAVDVVSLDDDLSQYKVVVVPNQYMMSRAQTAVVRGFVEAGGHLLVSYFSGIVNEDDEIVENAYPGALRDIIGGHVRELSPLAPNGTVTIRSTAGATLLAAGFTATGTQWQDDLIPEGARVAAEYTDGYLTGQPAVLDHQLGDGRVVYLGTRLDDVSLETIIAATLNDAGVRPVHTAPQGVEVTRRATETHSFLFALNHRQDTAQLTAEQTGVDLLTGRRLEAGDHFLLEPGDVIIVQTDRQKQSPNDPTPRDQPKPR
jgi:beta-galactosidase